MQAPVRFLLLFAAWRLSLFVTSAVVIRSGPAYEGIVEPQNDCGFRDKAISAIRIDQAILNEDGQEIGRATICACSKTKSAEEYWSYTLDEGGLVQDKRKDIVRFDDRGHIIEIATHTWDDNQEVIHRAQMTYDAEGRLSEDRTLESDGETQISRHTYDEWGNLITSAETDRNGNPLFVIAFRYDDQHHVLAKMKDGKPESYSRYDLQGRLIEEVSGTGENKITYLYTYDGQGRPLSKRLLAGPSQQLQWVNGFSYWPNGLIKEDWLFRPATAYPSWESPGLRLESYAYDENDHVTQEWTYSQGGKGARKNFVIPVNGRLETFGASNGLPSFAYTYDSHGNWNKAVETMLSDSSEPASKREIQSIFYRQIDYR